MEHEADQTSVDSPHLLEDWLDRSELASQLGVSVDTLARWESQRTGPACIRLGRKVLYRRAVVEKWLCDQERRRPRAKVRR